MGLSTYSLGFRDGHIVRGEKLNSMHPGKIWWVNNSSVLPDQGIAGSDSNDGSYLKPFSTLDYAIGRCTANRGDVIAIMPGHSETITGDSEIDFDVAGIKVIGLGHGNKMAEIEFNNAAATVAVGADNIVLENIRFNSSITSVADGVVIEDGINYTTIRNCMFDVDAAGTDEFTDCISLVNNNTGTLIEDCTFDMGIAAAVSAIHMDADTAKTTIRNCIIRGDYSTACIIGDTTASTNVDINGNLLVNGVGGDINTEPVIELLTGTTGIIRDNYCVCNLATKVASIVSDTCLLFENYYNEDIQGTGGLIGTVSDDD